MAQHYNYNRYYDASLGRYLSADPLGQAGDFNTFAYARSNPLNSMDPLGLECFEVGRVPVGWRRTSTVDWGKDETSYLGVTRMGGTFPVFWWNYNCRCMKTKTGTKTTTNEITFIVLEMCTTCFGPYFQQSRDVDVYQTQSKVVESEIEMTALGMYMIHTKAVGDCRRRCGGR